MPDGSPFEAELCDVQKGDLYVRKMASGQWSNPARATRDHDSFEHDTVVILERRPPWPDGRLIRIISGRDHNEQIREGTFALRTPGGGYYTDDGRNLYDSPRVIIDQWENMPIVSARVLGAVLASAPNPDEIDNERYKNSLQNLWGALNEVMSE
jgi:hypothetical protein